MKKILIAVFAFTCFLLASCGPAAPATELNVTITDFQFSPGSFTVPAGQEITVNITNGGAVLHNLVIMKSGTEAGDAFTDDDLPNVYWKVDVKPGEQIETSFTAPAEPGEYQFLCSVEGHMTAGMIGTLVVVNP